jgi:hypothetical protein
MKIEIKMDVKLVYPEESDARLIGTSLARLIRSGLSGVVVIEKLEVAVDEKEIKTS